MTPPPRGTRGRGRRGDSRGAGDRHIPLFGRKVMQDWLEPLAGGIVLAITLLDVFLTVLYARAGTGILAPLLARGVWRSAGGPAEGTQASSVTAVPCNSWLWC